MSENLYLLSSIKHRYGNGDITLNIDNLSIKKGSITGVVGPNGSGKSTLLKMLAFLEPSTDGTILYSGESSRGREKQLQREITYLLQEPYLLKRTVYENIAYGLKLRGETEKIKERIYDALKRVDLPPVNFANRSWQCLSGGEVQRVALATRLALHPKVLLLDEPTANVDEKSAQLVKEAALSSWKEWGTTVIIATHDLVWLHEVSTEIVSLYQGYVIGKEIENIIHGKWTVNKGAAVCRLSDGQILYGFCSLSSTIVAAIISPSKISISKTKQTPSEKINVLKGSITQLLLENSKDSVYVFIKVADIILKTRITVEQMKISSIYPSTEVWISFSSESLRWI